VSTIHLKPPRRHDPPLWLKQPLGRFQSAQLPWPRAWAAALLLLNGLAHVARAGWMLATTGHVTISLILIGLFGLSYLLLGIGLTRTGPRMLRAATIISAAGLVLGTLSFVISFDQFAGVNWSALFMLLLNVLILPLCAAGLQLPHWRGSATRPPSS
jgi:hypothetical protein